MQEYIGVGGSRITLDGENLFIKQVFMKTNCTISDIMSVTFKPPTPLLKGNLIIVVDNMAYTIIFKTTQEQEFRNLYDLLQTKMNCSGCQQVTSGSPLPSTIKFCPVCGTSVAGLKFCPECGFKVSTASPIGSQNSAANSTSILSTQPSIEKFYEQKNYQSSGLCCPKCQSHNIDLWSNTANMKEVHRTGLNLNPLHPLTPFKTKTVIKEKKSAAKIGLGVMTGGVSLLATGINKKAHNEYYCRDCGNRWIGK